MKRIKRVLNVLCEKQQQQQQQQHNLLVTKFVLDPSRDSTCCTCPLLKCNRGISGAFCTSWVKEITLSIGNV